MGVPDAASASAIIRILRMAEAHTQGYAGSIGNNACTAWFTDELIWFVTAQRSPWMSQPNTVINVNASFWGSAASSKREVQQTTLKRSIWR